MSHALPTADPTATARRYGGLGGDQTYVQVLDSLKQICCEMIDGYVAEHILQPLARAIAAN